MITRTNVKVERENTKLSSDLQRSTGVRVPAHTLCAQIRTDTHIVCIHYMHVIHTTHIHVIHMDTQRHTSHTYIHVIHMDTQRHTHAHAHARAHK